ncbi:MAG: hypothetical protein KME27_10885 [Lyngbya sp. HA4199-MV5]|jgi:hypothetical protein|nr:hypothetical protein [Lyngbya sp. HA4199-MV5]
MSDLQNLSLSAFEAEVRQASCTLSLSTEPGSDVLEQGVWFLNCPDGPTADRFLSQRRRLAQIALFNQVPQINVRVSGDRYDTICPSVHLLLGAMPQNRVLTVNDLPRDASGMRLIGDRSILRSLVLSNPNLKVIQFSNDVGLASGSNCLSACALSVEQWEGRRMHGETQIKGIRTWIPEYWEQFQTLLFSHASTDVEFDYPAFRYDGSPIYQFVRAGLAIYRDPQGKSQLVRMVDLLQLKDGH